MKKAIYLVAAAVILTVSACASKSGNSDSAESGKVEATEATAPAVIVYNGAEDLTSAPDSMMTVIDFNATWCGPCREFAPIFKAVAEEMKGKAMFYSVDIDKNPTIAEAYNVMAIPTVVVVLPDGTVRSQVGLMDADELRALIK